MNTLTTKEVTADKRIPSIAEFDSRVVIKNIQEMSFLFPQTVIDIKIPKFFKYLQIQKILKQIFLKAGCLEGTEQTLRHDRADYNK